MIVDTHCHIWEPSILRGGMKTLMEAVAAELQVSDPAHLADGSASRLVDDMDAAGIDKTVILPLDSEFRCRADGFTFRDYNDMAGAYAKAYPDRIVPFAGVDPRRGQEAVEELRRCVEEMGFRGLKLWTVMGFRANDEDYYPLYEEAARLGVTVLVHTGMGPGETYLDTCRPLFVDRPAVDFREINFIMAHVGAPWVDEALAVALKNSNVYVDISAWQRTARILPIAFAQMLSTAKVLHGGVHKILFGSDWPLFTEILDQKAWVDTVRNLELPPPLQMIGLPELTAEDKDAILGGNAVRLLGL